MRFIQKRTYLKNLILLFTFMIPICCMADGEENSGDRENASVTTGIYEIASELGTDFLLDLRTCTWDRETGECTEYMTGQTGEIQLFQKLDVNQQKYYLEQLENNRYRLGSLANAMALAHGETDSQPQPILEDWSGEPDETVLASQIWILTENKDGSYFIHTEDGDYLTAQSSYAYNGEAVGLSSFTGRKNQKWRFSQSWISKEDYADTDQPNPYAPGGQYEKAAVKLVIGEGLETITHETIASWITADAEHKLQVDMEAVCAFIQTLAQEYDTQGVPRRFKDSYGQEFILKRGNFGWKTDVEKTAAVIAEAMKTNGWVRVETQWAHRGVSFEKGNDIGDSYVEVDLTNQKVWLYVEGECLLETDCVTGTYGTDRQTPGGVYSITGMRSPATLRGPGYASDVTYWMPFNGGIGLHDATWRTSFGGEIYKTNGSHGCINLPLEAAARIYEKVSVGFPVVCYN